MGIAPPPPKPAGPRPASSTYPRREMLQSHRLLDAAGIPRTRAGVVLTLPQRIAWMHGQLVSARLAQKIAFAYGGKRR